jgi:hypothetical protein
MFAESTCSGVSKNSNHLPVHRIWVKHALSMMCINREAQTTVQNAFLAEGRTKNSFFQCKIRSKSKLYSRIRLVKWTEKVFHSHVWNKKVFHSHVWNKKVFHSHVWNKKVFHRYVWNKKVFYSHVWNTFVFHTCRLCTVWTEKVFHSPVWTETVFHSFDHDYYSIWFNLTAVL